MDKDIVVRYIGEGSFAKTAERLGYKSTQVVYNWPKHIGQTLLEAIILRMQAKRIKVPEDWH